MKRVFIFAFPLFCVLTVNAQSTKRMPSKAPGTEKPTCSPGAICFSDKISAGEEFRKTLNDQLEFVLKPGWNIGIVPKQPEGTCDELASVVNAPYRAHRDLYIDTSYGWTAEQEMSVSPREFLFATNCAEYRIEAARLDIVLWPYTATQQKYEEALANLGTSASGKGRLWITASKISHAGDTLDEKLGRIEWMTFTVEIKLGRTNK